jgi:hypothetical protein
MSAHMLAVQKGFCTTCRQLWLESPLSIKTSENDLQNTCLYVDTVHEADAEDNLS